MEGDGGSERCVAFVLARLSRSRLRSSSASASPAAAASRAPRGHGPGGAASFASSAALTRRWSLGTREWRLFPLFPVLR